MGATEHLPIRFHAMAKDLAIAVRTARRQGMGRTFKAVKHMPLTGHDDFEGFVVIVAADFALGHCRTPCW